VNGNVKLGRAAARSGEWAQHFSNASCFIIFFRFSAVTFRSAVRCRPRHVHLHRTSDDIVCTWLVMDGWMDARRSDVADTAAAAAAAAAGGEWATYRKCHSLT